MLVFLFLPANAERKPINPRQAARTSADDRDRPIVKDGIYIEGDGFVFHPTSRGTTSSLATGLGVGNQRMIRKPDCFRDVAYQSRTLTFGTPLATGCTRSHKRIDAPRSYFDGSVRVTCPPTLPGRARKIKINKHLGRKV